MPAAISTTIKGKIKINSLLKDLAYCNQYKLGRDLRNLIFNILYYIINVILNRKIKYIN